MALLNKDDLGWEERGWHGPPGRKPKNPSLFRVNCYLPGAQDPSSQEPRRGGSDSAAEGEKSFSRGGGDFPGFTQWGGDSCASESHPQLQWLKKAGTDSSRTRGSYGEMITPGSANYFGRVISLAGQITTGRP